MDKVVFITTGGTIAMRQAEGGGATPQLTGAELIKAVPALQRISQVEVRQFANMPSGRMNGQLMRQLAHISESALAEEDTLGVVITHGTDTLEETAYFLDLYIADAKPVVVTGAMRTPEEAGAEGPANILAAARVAAGAEAKGYGVLVVLNDEIHAARDVTKTHAGNAATFKSPLWGAVGYADADRLIFRRTLPKQANFRPELEESDIHLIKFHTGITPFFFNALLEKGAKGVVVEGFGRGNCTPETAAAIKELIKRGTAVVLATRCQGGRTLPLYGYEGGGLDILKAGAIPAGELNGQKAAVKLGLILGLTNNLEEVRKLWG